MMKMESLLSTISVSTALSRRGEASTVNDRSPERFWNICSISTIGCNWFGDKMISC